MIDKQQMLNEAEQDAAIALMEAVQMFRDAGLLDELVKILGPLRSEINKERYKIKPFFQGM